MYYDHSRVSGFYCQDHRRYTGKRQPRVACQACWWLYFAARGQLWMQGVEGLLSDVFATGKKQLARAL